MSQLEPSIKTMGAIADAIGHDVTRGYNINHAKKLKIANGIKFPLQLNFSHSAGNESYHLVAWKLSGELYIAVSYEHVTDVTTIIMLDKTALLKDVKDKNISNYVLNLDDNKKIETLDDYINSMLHGMVHAAFRRGPTGAFTKLDISEL